MKRTLIIIALLSLTLFCFAEALQLGVGVDFSGKHQVKSSLSDKTWDVDNGYAFFAEYLLKTGYLQYGLGATYQLPRIVTINGVDGKVSFIPLYMTVKVQAPNSFAIRPEVIGQFGYSFFSADDAYKNGADLSGGFYWGAGAGVQMQIFILRLMYKVDTGVSKRDILGYTYSQDITHSQVNLSAGLSF